MQEFKDKVVVVTGAADGIGLALAKKCAAEGMKVVMADVVEDKLQRAEQNIRMKGASALAVKTDVSKAEDMETLAKKTIDAFGAVHLLFNNAGVGVSGLIWEGTVKDWEWVIGVNLWGVIHGIRIFVPLMLKQDTPCHIINTASAAGLFSGPDQGIYKVTKHGVVSLSETLHHELRKKEAKINISVLCPGMVATRFSAQKRPDAFKEPMEKIDSGSKATRDAIAKLMLEQGMPTDQVADMVFEGIRNDRFYILTHPGFKSFVRTRMEDILHDRTPTNPFAKPEDLVMK